MLQRCTRVQRATTWREFRRALAAASFVATAKARQNLRHSAVGGQAGPLPKAQNIFKAKRLYALYDTNFFGGYHERPE